MEQRQGVASEEHSSRVSELESKLAESIRKEKETRLKAIEMLERYDEAEEKLKGEYDRRINEL